VLSIFRRGGLPLQQIVFKGKIVTGNGEGRTFVNLWWVKKQIKERLHFTAYPGTLNLLLNHESNKIKKFLKKSQFIRISPVEGFCEGIAYPAHINSIKCAIIIPEIENYPKNLIEIVAPINLRDSLNAKDGDELSVSFFV